jgi:hypothetical protein
MPPPFPAAFIPRASAVSRAIAAAACTPGRFDPTSVAVPASSGYRLTFACRSAACRRSSAPAGSTRRTARRNAARSCPVDWPPAPGSTRPSTARASSSLSGAVASATSRARPRSMAPAASAAPAARSRQPSVTARSAHHDAPTCDMASASDTSLAADAVTRSGRPSSSTSARRSRAADRDAIAAMAVSSPACAHDATRR